LMEHRKYRPDQRKAARGIHCITLSVANHPAVVIAFGALHWRAILEFSTRAVFVRPPAYHAGLSYAGWFRLEEKPWSLRESMSASGRPAPRWSIGLQGCDPAEDFPGFGGAAGLLMGAAMLLVHRCSKHRAQAAFHGFSDRVYEISAFRCHKQVGADQ
jgi:hypothetical protein